MMDDKRFTQLNDYLDGELNEAEVAEFERRLADDAELQTELNALRNLLREAQRLPKSLQPERDLWQSIESRLHEPAESGPSRVIRFRRRGDRDRRTATRTSPWPLVAAVGVVLALFLGVQYFSTVSVEAPGSETPRITHVPNEAPADTQAASIDVEYEQTRAELLALLEARRADLPENTLAVVEENLTIIENAVIDINRALAEHPEDPKLAGLLHQAYRHEMDVLHRAVQLPKEDD